MRWKLGGERSQQSEFSCSSHIYYLIPFLVQNAPNYLVQTEGDASPIKISNLCTALQCKILLNANVHINDFFLDYAVILSFYKVPRVS